MAALLGILVLVTFIAFVLLQVIPGDAALVQGADMGITQEEIEAARQELGLDRPVAVQYLDWLANALQGDFGESYITGRPVTSLIAARLPVTLSLTAAAVVLIVPLSILLGVLAGAFEGRLIDRVITGWASMAVAAPTFWIGLLLVLVFAIQNPWLPATGFVPPWEEPVAGLKTLALPAITLAVAYSSAIARQLRVSVADTLNSDYIRAAEARGLPWWRVLVKHALRNAAPPAVTLFGLEVIALIGGSVVIEAVFAIPGLGALTISSVLARDIPVIQAILLLAALTAIVVNLAVDMTYKVLNPRLR